MRKYFIYDGQLKKGPLNLEQLKSGPLSKETPIWYEGLQDWVSAGNMKELNDYFIQKSTPPPLPKALKSNTPSRNAILNSFSAAEEAVSRPPKKSYKVLLIMIIVIAAIIVALLFMPVKFK